MSETDDKPGEKVPWDELSNDERRQFYELVREAGLNLGKIPEAEPYYGNKHRLMADLQRARATPEYDPAHDKHYGHIQEEGAEVVIELYGVGEFAPNVPGAGTPVFEAKTENGSYLTFCFPPDEVSEEFLRVFHANSYEEGEFALLMNRVLSHFQGANPEPKEVVFTNVVTQFLDGADLDDKVHGFESETVEVPETGEKLRELVGTWDPTGGDV